MVKYAEKAYGVRLSLLTKDNTDYMKVCEVIFNSYLENLLFESVQNIYYFSDKKLDFKIHFYVKAETIDEKHKVLERHFLWYEKKSQDFENLIKTNNIGFFDKE